MAPWASQRCCAVRRAVRRTAAEGAYGAHASEGPAPCPNTAHDRPRLYRTSGRHTCSFFDSGRFRKCNNDALQRRRKGGGGGGVKGCQLYLKSSPGKLRIARIPTQAARRGLWGLGEALPGTVGRSRTRHFDDPRQLWISTELTWGRFKPGTQTPRPPEGYAFVRCEVAPWLAL